MKELAAQSEGRTLPVDLATRIPWVGVPKAERQINWDNDGVHFKPAGYAAIAGLIFEVLAPFL